MQGNVYAPIFTIFAYKNGNSGMITFKDNPFAGAMTFVE